MDLSFIIGRSLILVTVAGVIVYLWQRNKQRIQRTLEPLKEFAAESNTEIAAYDAWENTIIGITTGEPGTLYFIRNNPDREYRERVNLSEVFACRISKAARKVFYMKEYVNVIDRIELIFSFADHRPELSLEFYNNDFDSLTLTGEMQLAQKWAGVVKNAVRTGREPNVRERAKEPANAPVPRSAVKALVYPKPGKSIRPAERLQAD